MLLATEHLNATPWPKRWLWLGVTALAIAGIFSIILVAARTPQLAAFQNLFSVALVIHVDLSVFVWFLAIAGMLIAYAENARGIRWTYFQPAAFGTTAAATALIALSPLDPQWDVIKSNYIPVLHNIIFLLGLSLLMAGMIISVLPNLFSAPSRLMNAQGMMERSINWAAGIIAIAIACFIATGQKMPSGLPQDYMFETLFWAGGHTLQFLYGLLTVLGWLVLITAINGAPGEGARKKLEWLLFIPLIAAFSSLLPYLLYDVTSGEFREYFTKAMIHLGGAAPILIGAYVLFRLRNICPKRENRALYASLIMSLILFFAGGFIGYLITGQNVTIPAHYHGSIVGVTLALMGMAYVLLPQFGYRNVASWRMAFWQPILYGCGQLMHIGGLAWSGGYGVLRKTPGQELSAAAKTAMGIMGMGGLLAIIGGLLFVIVVFRAARTTNLVEK